MARSKITESTKQTAIQMRTEGALYPEITEALSGEGVTLNWCKRNLNTIKVYDAHFYVVEELTPLATRPEGISRLEFRTQIKRGYSIPFSEPIPEAIDKRTRRALPEDAFIRPDWMEPDAARECQQEIIQNAAILFDRIEEMVDEYCAKHPAASRWHVRNEIVTLATGAHPAGPMVQGERMLDAVDTMEERVPQRKSEEFTFLRDVEYDSLCM